MTLTFDLQNLIRSLVGASVGCVGTVVERRSVTGELSLSYARPAADGDQLCR